MKKIVFFTIIIISLFTIKELVQSIVTLWQKQNLIIHTKKELNKEVEENRVLKNKLAHTESILFIEEEARNRLFMARPNEEQIIIPPELLPEEEKSEKRVIADTRPNWKQWIDLFIY